MISAAILVNVILLLVFAGLVYWLVSWAIGAMGIPEPFNKIINVILILIVLFICLNALFMLFGHPLVSW